MSNIIILGEALIDIFAEPGTPLRDAKTLHPRPGGAPANVAVALARLGAEVGFIGKVGVDDYGDYLRDLLGGEGVDITHFVGDPHAPTMVAIVAAPSPTEQHFVLHSGASVLLAPEDLPQAFIESSRLFNFGSVSLSGGAAAATIQAAEWAQQAGSIVHFDVNLRPALWADLDVARQKIIDCLPLTTVLKVNESELTFLTGETDPSVGSKQLLEEYSQSIQLCCVSLGGDGAFFCTRSASGLVPIFDVDVKDTTGSGDSFVAGLSYQLTHNTTPIPELTATELTKMITFANACGGLAATEVGGMSASPTLEKVEQFLAQQEA